MQKEKGKKSRRVIHINGVKIVNAENKKADMESGDIIKTEDAVMQKEKQNDLLM
jgi:23S rRNA maturation-related 3'-5' exoribonuclease YhaM